MTLPYVHEGKYGRVTLDHAASGHGYVVDFRAAGWVKLQQGDRSTWATFQSFHAALAYFWALSGRQEHPETGRGVKGSRRPAKAGRGQPLMPLEVS